MVAAFRTFIIQTENHMELLSKEDKLVYAHMIFPSNLSFQKKIQNRVAELKSKNHFK